MRKWSPSSDFLSKSKCQIETPHGPLAIEWEFFALPKIGLLKLIGCKMRVNSTETLGFGEGLVYKTAVIKAFCEAWERWWFTTKRSAEVPNTNGFAAGATLDDAKDRARAELIERHLFITAWTSMIGFRTLSLPTWVNVLLHPAVDRGWAFQLFEIDSNLNKTVFLMIGTHQRLGLVLDTIAKIKGSSAQTKLALSILKSVSAAEFMPYRRIATLNSFGGPLDHLTFYRDPQNSQAADFLLKGDFSKEPLTIHHIDTIETEVVIDHDLMPSVARAFNKNWPPLRWGAQSIAGKNPWPHPLG